MKYYATSCFYFFVRLVFFGTSGIEHDPHEGCYAYVDNY